MKNSLSWRVKSTGRDAQGENTGSRPRAKINDDPLSWAAGSSCKQTHHNKPSVICFCPTANRFCGFCRVERILRTEASISDLVTVNYGTSLDPRGQKGTAGHKSKQLLFLPGKQQSFSGAWNCKERDLFSPIKASLQNNPGAG